MGPGFESLIVHQNEKNTLVGVFFSFQSAGTRTLEGVGKSLIFFERSESPLIVHQKVRHIPFGYVFYFIVIRDENPARVRASR